MRKTGVTTVTIPKELHQMAKEAGLNVSKVLKEALEDKFGSKPTKRYVGWLVREPEVALRDNWRGTIGRANDPKANQTSSRDVEKVIEWFDDQLGTKVKFEETLGSQLGFRAFVEE